MQSAKRQHAITAIVQGRFYRDYLAGALLLGAGAFAIFNARTYGVGSVRDMGPGFFPVAIGVMLAIIGAIIVLVALGSQVIASRSEADSPRRRDTMEVTAPAVSFSVEKPEWRGWLCIIASLIVFILVANHGGLLPATFLSVLVAALGDRQNTLRAAVVLALGICVIAVVVFYWALSIQLPLFAWGGN